jgi:phosphate:Na+ symporter
MKIYECIISLLGGIGLFISAMDIMSSSLQKVAGAGMRHLLGSITSNRFAGVGIGALVTIIIQSSSATTVMTIGFVNANTMTLNQAAAVIMGANIGTTITGILASLQSLNLSLYLSFLTFIGVVLIFFKKDKIKNIGGIISGLGMIFIGLTVMSNSFEDEGIKKSLRNGLEKIDFPLALLFLGILFTALMQSSSAMTGLIIVMVESKTMEMSNALFIILGANIGTCVTALISIIGTSVNAKRTGIIHLLFNIIGTFFFTIVVWSTKGYIVKFLGLITSKPAMQIAWFHVFFNVTTTIILLPFINLLVFISCKIIKDKNNYYNSKNIKGFKYINNRFTFAPEIAVEQVKKEIINMANLSKINLEKSIEEICEQKNQSVDEIYAREDLINFLNVETTKFIVKLAPKLNEQATEDVSNYLHLLNDIARIGDHAKKILDDSIDMRKKKIKFNDEEKKEINEIKDVSFKIFELTFKIFENNSFKELTNFEELLEKTKILQKEADQKNFERLQNKKSDFESGTYYISIFTHFESICSHLENITDFFGKDNKNLTFNTSEGKDYVMVINKNNLKKNEDVSTVRKMNANENSINDFSEKINNSFG